MCHYCPTFLKKIFFTLCWFIASVHAVAAVDSMSLTATPVRLGDDYSIRIAPGEKKQVQIKVRNGATSAVSVETLASDFIVAEDGATPILLDAATADPRWSLAEWLTLAPSQHQLDSEEVATVNVLIEVPADALPGGRYAMIYHRPVSAATASPISGSGVSQRVGTLLYVIVDGPVNEEAYINSFSWPEFLEHGPVAFDLRVDNQSDVHIYAKPVVKIYNMFGRQIASIELDGRNIFPKSTRDFTGNWEKVWGFGYYKAVVESPYGNQGMMMSASAGLWMIPVKLLLFVCIIILIITILFIALKKQRAASASKTQSPARPESDHHAEESDQLDR